MSTGTGWRPPSRRRGPGSPRAGSRSGPRCTGRTGPLLGRGHNRRVQDGDPSTHAETAAFRAAGRQRSYRGTTMVTTLSPCWYCSGLVRQFGISRVVIGEAVTFHGGHDWLAEHGVEIVLLDDAECIALMRDFIEDHPDLWNEDIGDDVSPGFPPSICGPGSPGTRPPARGPPRPSTGPCGRPVPAGDRARGGPRAAAAIREAAREFFRLPAGGEGAVRRRVGGRGWLGPGRGGQRLRGGHRDSRRT